MSARRERSRSRTRADLEEINSDSTGRDEAEVARAFPCNPPSQRPRGECAICLGDLCDAEGSVGTSLLCGHAFHVNCFRNVTRCPVCRLENAAGTTDEQRGVRRALWISGGLRLPWGQRLRLRLPEKREGWRELLVAAYSPAAVFGDGAGVPDASTSHTFTGSVAFSSDELCARLLLVVRGTWVDEELERVELIAKSPVVVFDRSAPVELRSASGIKTHRNALLALASMQTCPYFLIARFSNDYIAGAEEQVEAVRGLCTFA